MPEDFHKRDIGFEYDRLIRAPARGDSPRLPFFLLLSSLTARISIYLSVLRISPESVHANGIFRYESLTHAAFKTLFTCVQAVHSALSIIYIN